MSSLMPVLAEQSSDEEAPGSYTSELPPLRDGVAMDALIDTPHVLGRVRQLRSGQLIEPIGRITLHPDGQLSGHRHPNEGSWIPYAYGQVDADSAFAFITSQNNWIPSSTWTQSMGGMPIGYFCDEPELGQSLQQMCLIPDTRLFPRATAVYLVASCLRFYKRTVPILLKQLYVDGITPSQVKVVVNGCDRAHDEIVDGVEHAFSTHNAWEWSALYEAPRRWRADYFFLIHDTSVVHPGFRQSVEAANGFCYWDHLPASPMARCLLGLYSHSFLQRCNAWLESIDHIDKRNGVIAEAAGELLLRARSAYVMGDPELNGSARAAEWTETIDQFGTGSPRVRRVFPAVNIDKFIHTGPTNPTSL